MSAAPDPSDPPAEPLAAAVASRICHDLVSPVGAVVNGTELIAETGGGAEEAAMIRASAERAGAMLAWARLAFGAGAGEGEPTPRARLAGLASAVVATRRVAVEIAPLEGPALSRAEARLAALMLLAGRGAVGLRGRLALGLGTRPGLDLACHAEGAPAPEEMRARISAARAEPDPRSVELALLDGAARAAGFSGVRPASEGGALVLVAAPG